MDTRDIFNKAIERAKANGVEEFDRYGVIVFLENEIDRYRVRIKQLEESNKSLLHDLIVGEREITTLEAVQEKEQPKTFEKLEITFKSGETITYKSGEWDDYSFTGGAVNVKRGGAWIGIYNFDDVFCVELK